MDAALKAPNKQTGKEVVQTGLGQMVESEKIHWVFIEDSFCLE